MRRKKHQTHQRSTERSVLIRLLCVFARVCVCLNACRHAWVHASISSPPFPAEWQLTPFSSPYHYHITPAQTQGIHNQPREQTASLTMVSNRGSVAQRELLSFWGFKNHVEGLGCVLACMVHTTTPPLKTKKREKKKKKTS